MAINKNSTGYTFVFSIIMVVIVGTSLAYTSLSLKPLQKANAADKKMVDILAAIKVQSSRETAEADFQDYVKERIVIKYSGVAPDSLRRMGEIKSSDKGDAFNIDVKKLYRANKPEKGDVTWSNAENLSFPLFICEKEGDTTLYVLPVVGSGLWGPIWGYVALEKDYKTIYGVKFDHKTETPGLGAEIREDFFSVKFKGKTLQDVAPYFKVHKGGAKTDEHSVDGITGGTITSKGVEEMMNRTLDIYNKFFESEAK